MTEDNVIAAKVAPSEALKQQLPADAKEKVVASNLPPAVEEPANKVISGFIGNHALINLEKEEEPTAIVDNDPSA